MTEQEHKIIKEAAENYDIDYDEVKYIREYHPNNFYQALEEYARNKEEIDFLIKKFPEENE